MEIHKESVKYRNQAILHAGAHICMGNEFDAIVEDPGHVVIGKGTKEFATSKGDESKDLNTQLGMSWFSEAHDRSHICCPNKNT